MTSESQKRASKAYKSKLHQYVLYFRDEDNELWEYFQAQENKQQYIKDMISRDMKEKK